MMKAWTYDHHGGPEVLTLTDLPRPEPGPGDLLVKVSAAALNAADRHMLTGRPLLVRAVARARSRPTIGSDVAGVVDAVGAEVTGFAVGDRVHAEIDRGGAAEYALVPASAAARIPDGQSFPDAAAVGMAAITALHAVREGGAVGEGSRVLVIGAAGGVGTFAVQLARAFGATVTGVTSARNTALVEGLGATVIPYDERDPADEARNQDVVIDIVGNRTLRALRSLAVVDGRIVLVGGGGGPILGPAGQVLGSTLPNPFIRQRLHPVMDSRPSGDDLRVVDGLVHRGLVRPVIDRVVPFADVPAAMAHLLTRRARGKIVIDVTDR